MPKPDIINHRTVNARVATLKPHPKNPRKGDVEAIGDSIDELGFYGRVIAQESTNRILAGEHRWHAAKARGMKSIPVQYVDVDDETALKIVLADNRISDRSDYDSDLLLDVLTDVGDRSGSLAGTGYTEADLKLLNEANDNTITSNKEIDPDDLLDDDAQTCPRCGFEFNE